MLTSLHLRQDLKYCLFYSSLSLDIWYGLLTAETGVPSYMIWCPQLRVYLWKTESVSLHILPTAGTT